MPYIKAKSSIKQPIIQNINKAKQILENAIPLLLFIVLIVFFESHILMNIIKIKQAILIKNNIRKIIKIIYFVLYLTINFYIFAFENPIILLSISFQLIFITIWNLVNILIRCYLIRHVGLLLIRTTII